MPVKDGESEKGSVAVGGEGRLGQGRQVVHVEEAGAVCVVVARQQQVHMIWSLMGGGREPNTGGLTFRSGEAAAAAVWDVQHHCRHIEISQSRTFTSGKRFRGCVAGGCWFGGEKEKKRKTLCFTERQKQRRCNRSEEHSSIKNQTNRTNRVPFIRNKYLIGLTADVCNRILLKTKTQCVH